MTDPRRERALRRSVPFLAVGTVLLLMAVPAFFDLRRLFVWTGLVAIALGVVSALFNWYDRPATGVRRQQDDGVGRGTERS